MIANIASADPFKCLRFYRSYDNLASAPSKLSEVPFVQSMFKAFIDDPTIPSNIRNVLVASLGADTTIKNLTTDLREQMQIGWDTNAFVLATNLGFQQGKTNYNLIQIGIIKFFNLAKRILPTPKVGSAEYRVFIQDGRFSSSKNDFITLIHELAHVRFAIFIRRNLKSLASRWPPNVIRKMGNQYTISGQFFMFLTERYAWEIEYQVMKYGLRKRLVQFPLYRYENADDITFRQKISAMIIDEYEINDPRVLALKDHSISEILRGHF